MAVIKNHKTGMWEVRTYYKDLTGARKQKTKRGFAKKSEASMCIFGYRKDQSERYGGRIVWRTLFCRDIGICKRTS